jgi:hypothetical protein
LYSWFLICILKHWDYWWWKQQKNDWLYKNPIFDMIFWLFGSAWILFFFHKFLNGLYWISLMRQVWFFVRFSMKKVFKNRIFSIFGLIRWAIIPASWMGSEYFVGLNHGEWTLFKTSVYLKIGLIFFSLKCRTNKITQNDLKMAEHRSEENCLKVVEIFFRLNINGNMIRKLLIRIVKFDHFIEFGYLFSKVIRDWPLIWMFFYDLGLGIRNYVKS